MEQPFRIYNSTIKSTEKERNHRRFLLKDETGTGQVDSYCIYPGVYVLSNEFQMEQAPEHILSEREFFEICYCREGRFECSFQNGKYTYLSAGDLILKKIWTNRIEKSAFPLRYYCGYALLIDMDEGGSVLSQILKDTDFDLRMVSTLLCGEDGYYAVQADESIRSVFEDIYQVPTKIKMDFLRVKTLELLLRLSQKQRVAEKWEYLPRLKVQKIKEIEKFLTEQLEVHYRLKDISERFDISLSALNHDFRVIYGDSVCNYMRSYRMQVAAVLLRSTSDSVTGIAGKVGYENISKFSHAFKLAMKKTPLNYRKDCSSDGVILNQLEY